MKSKFDGIVKVKKQELDYAESVLVKAKDNERRVQKSIDEVVGDILAFQTPNKGNFALIAQSRETLLILRKHKRHLDDELIKAKMHVQNTQRLYEEANKEYEKMIYLKEEEISKKIKQIQRQEQLDMDETALQLYAGRMS